MDQWLGYYEDEGIVGLIGHQQGGDHRGVFEQRAELKTELIEGLRQGPGEPARQEMAVGAGEPGSQLSAAESLDVAHDSGDV